MPDDDFEAFELILTMPYRIGTTEMIMIAMTTKKKYFFTKGRFPKKKPERTKMHGQIIPPNIS